MEEDISSDEQDFSDGSDFEAVGELLKQKQDNAGRSPGQKASFAEINPIYIVDPQQSSLKRKRSSEAATVPGKRPGPDNSSKVATQSGANSAGPANANTDNAQRTGQRSIAELNSTPMLLPARLVFPIQIGSDLFRLSGVSISSDAPSYFSRFFEAQLKSGIEPEAIKTLYIDRDPETFRDISLHLQGYHIEPRDGPHFVRLYADSIFFSLPRLREQLSKSTIFIKVGNEEFKIPRDLFNGPGDTPNYFSLAFSGLFNPSKETFPGLKTSQLLRPPPILPPQITARSARIFRDLLHVLKGYDLKIRDEEHRTQLVRDARYFHLRGLEQRLIAHQLIFNPWLGRKEIILRLDDFRQSGVSYDLLLRDPPIVSNENPPPPAKLSARIAYARPFLDPSPTPLILEVASGIDLHCSLDMAQNRMTISPSIRAKFSVLCKTACDKLSQEMLGHERPEIDLTEPTAVIERNASVKLNGTFIDWRNVDEGGSNDLSTLWMASLPEPPEEEQLTAEVGSRWSVSRSQWRVQIVFQREPKPTMTVNCFAVKIEAVSGQAEWNEQREWL